MTNNRKPNLIAAMTLGTIVLFAQSPQQLSVLSGTALATGLALGIDTLPSHITNWLTVEPPTVSAPGDLEMVCPGGQASCFMFITDGPALSGYPRPGIDVSGYATLSVEIEGDAGTTVQVGIKDSTQPDNGSEPKVTVPVTSSWTTLSIPLSKFAGTNLKSIYVLCEFVFNGGSNSQTVRVRNIYYTAAGPATTYYFPHLALGGGFQTTFTYINYSPQSVTCQTTYFSDSGGPLTVPFAQGSASNRTDNLGPGASVHVQTTADLSAAVVSGWAEAQCTGQLKASLLYRLYSGSVAQGEASVNASTAPATEFVTFAQTQTGVAYANPSAVPADVTITVLDSSGNTLGSTKFVLQPNQHGAANLGPLLGLTSFTGSVQITSATPIICLSLNAEVYPVFSSLPAGDLPDGTPLQ
jgi:hypothetical protein